MDILKRIKAFILFIITILSLSGCSKEDIDTYIKNNYKVIAATVLNDESTNYYLIKMDKIDCSKFQVIGEFATMAEARAYLDTQLTKDEDSLLNEVILSGSAFIIVGTSMFLCINRQKKEEQDKVKVLKK